MQRREIFLHTKNGVEEGDLFTHRERCRGGRFVYIQRMVLGREICLHTENGVEEGDLFTYKERCRGGRFVYIQRMV